MDALVLFMTIPGLALRWDGGIGFLIGTPAAAWLASGEFGGSKGNLSMTSQFGIERMAGIGRIVWTGIASYVILRHFDVRVRSCVTAGDETSGLDLALHNEAGHRL